MSSNLFDPNPRRNTEHPNPDSPKSIIYGKSDDDTQDSEAPAKSFTDSPKRSAEQAGLNVASNEGLGGDSPKKDKSITLAEETNFAELFATALGVISKLKNLDLESIEKSAIDTVKESFFYGKGNRFADVDLEQPENICGFLYRYGLLSAGLTRHRILEALSNCKELQSQLSISSIKIISLGSGPGCDVIGLCSALYEYIKYREVILTLVDKYKGWISVFNVIEFLTREGEYGNASLIFQDSDVSTTFLRKDLSDTENDEAYRPALKGADVVLISRVFSISNFYDNETIAKTVVESMKVGALLLFIESPKIAERITEFYKNLKVIYKSEKIDDELEDYYVQSQLITTEFTAPKSNAQIYVMKKTLK